MSHVPDHTPAAAAVEHAALIAALDAGDLAGRERDRASALAGTCTGCASLLADLVVLRAATATLPAAPRTRDYRLTDADAARLRPSAWVRLVGWLGAPRSAVRPLAGGLAALGIAGLLLSTTPGFFGATGSRSTTGAPVIAPGDAGGAGAGAGGNALPSAAPSTVAVPAAAATVEPGATSAPGTFSAVPGAAALPVPSPAAVATPGSSGFSADASAATDSATKAAPPEASQGERNAALTATSEPAAPDRTLPQALSLALLAAGLGLFVANHVLRRRAGV